MLLIFGQRGRPSIPVLPGNEYILLDFIGDFDGEPVSGWDVAGTSEATKDHTLSGNPVKCFYSRRNCYQ